MNRLIFLAAIVAVVYLLLRSFRGRAPHETRPEHQEDMVRCSHCGVHLPKSESILSGGKYFCSDAHRQAHQSPPPDQNAR